MHIIKMAITPEYLIHHMSSELSLMFDQSAQRKNITNQIMSHHEELVFHHNEYKAKEFIIVSGPSGGGKTTLCNALQRNLKNIEILKKHTNRDIRDDEIDGIDYYFVDDTWFANSLKDKTIVSYADRYGNLYALSKEELSRAYANKNMPLVIFDVHLALKVQFMYSKANLIFIGPQNSDVIKSRLYKRGDRKADIEKRVILVDEELSLRNQFDINIVSPCEIQEMVDIIKDKIFRETLND